jgi:hypothetical protein
VIDRALSGNTVASCLRKSLNCSRLRTSNCGVAWQWRTKFGVGSKPYARKQGRDDSNRLQECARRAYAGQQQQQRDGSSGPADPPAGPTPSRQAQGCQHHQTASGMLLNVSSAFEKSRIVCTTAGS